MIQGQNKIEPQGGVTQGNRNEMQQLSAFAKKWPDVRFYTVSQDIPFALAYWMKQTNWRNVTVLSNFRNNNLVSLIQGINLLNQKNWDDAINQLEEFLYNDSF